MKHTSKEIGELLIKLSMPVSYIQHDIMWECVHQLKDDQGWVLNFPLSKTITHLKINNVLYSNYHSDWEGNGS